MGQIKPYAQVLRGTGN